MQGRGVDALRLLRMQHVQLVPHVAFRPQAGGEGRLFLRQPLTLLGEVAHTGKGRLRRLCRHDRLRIRQTEQAGVAIELGLGAILRPDYALKIAVGLLELADLLDQGLDLGGAFQQRAVNDKARQNMLALGEICRLALRHLGRLRPFPQRRVEVRNKAWPDSGKVGIGVDEHLLRIHAAQHGHEGFKPLNPCAPGAHLAQCRA